MTIKPILILCGLIFLAGSLPTYAYKPNEMRKIAAPKDTAISMLMGYNTRTGQYAEQCLKSVTKRRVGQSPPANANFKMVNSMNEFTSDRSFDLSVAVSVNLGIGSGSASVDTSFEEKMRKKVESKAAYARFSDLASPVFVIPNATFALNQRGQDAFAAAAKGKLKKFERECGDSVLIGFQKGRYFTGVGTLSKSSSSKSSERDTKVKLAARYMAVKMSASVEMSKAQKDDAKDLNIAIDYVMSGDTRVKGATNIDQLKKVFREFSQRPLSETQTYQYVYIIPYEHLVSESAFDFGLPPKQARNVKTIIDGIGVLAIAKNTAWLEKNQGAASGTIKDKNKISLAHKAFSTEYQYLISKLRASDVCIKKWDRPCENIYSKVNNYPDPDANNWLNPFLQAAYRSSDACASGFPVSTPTGRRLCKKCSLAKEPLFIKGKEASCGYLVENKPTKKVKRLWAHDLKISSAKGGSDSGKVQRELYPDFCKGKGKGCGKAAATRICKSKGLGAAKKFEKWGLHPRHPVHFNVYATQYANGKTCRVNKNSFEPSKCRTFKYIDCKKVGKQKTQSKDQSISS